AASLDPAPHGSENPRAGKPRAARRLLFALERTDARIQGGAAAAFVPARSVAPDREPVPGSGLAPAFPPSSAAPSRVRLSGHRLLDRLGRRRRDARQPRAVGFTR